MRLLSLSVVQWGALALQGLSFETEGRLQVIVGPNEAGKSTTLRAVRGLVRGLGEGDPAPMPLRSAIVKARVRGGQGQEAAVERRGSEGAYAPLHVHGALPVAAAWSRVSREAYDGVWCIDHDTLRRGGRALQRSDSGELGEALLRSLVDGDRLDRVSQFVTGRLADLFNPAPQATTRVLNKALAGVREGADRVRQASVGASDFERRLDAERDAAAALSAAEARQAAADRARKAADALVERAPVVAELDDVEAQLAAIGAEGHCPPSVQAAALKRAREAYARAAEDLASAVAQREEIERALSGMADPSAVLAVAPAWDEGARGLKGYTAAVSARRERAQAAASTARAWEDAAALLSGALPSSQDIDAMDRALDALVEAEAAVGRAADAVSDAQRGLAEAEGRKQRAPVAPPPDDALDAAAARLERARASWDQARATADKRLQAAKDLDAEAARRRLPQGVADAARLPVPGADERAGWRRRRSDCAEALVRARGKLDDAQVRVDAAARALDGAAVPAGAPDEAQLAAARARRDDALAAQWAGSGPGVAAVEALVRDADNVADVRFGLADQLGRRSQLVQAQSRAHDELGVASTALATCEAAVERLEAEWAEERVALGLPFIRLDGLDDWALGVEKLRADLALHQAGVAAAAAAEAEAQAALDGLREALGVASVPLAVPAVLEAVEAVKRVRAERAAQRQAIRLAEQGVDDARRRVEAAEAGRAQAERVCGRAAGEWGALAGRWGGPADGASVTAQPWLAVVCEARARLAARDEAARALAEVDETIQAFDACTRPLLALLDGDPGPAQRVELLEARVREARERALLRAEAQSRLLVAQARERDAEEAATRADAACGEAVAAAGLSERSEVPAALARVERATPLLEQRSALQAALGGASVEALRAEIQGRSLEMLRAAAHEAEQEVAAAREARDQGRAALDAAVASRAQVDGGARAAEEAQSVARHAASVRQYTDDLVRERAVSWMLAELQKVLGATAEEGAVKRAGEVFSEFTGGSFEGLGVLHDTVDGRQMRYLVGRRSNGELLVPSEMSDGTRDALWLALRVAVIEGELDRGVVLPVVLDDVCVHLSEDRTAAVLRLFGSLAQRTQVIWFTHHASVAALAAKVVPGCEIIELSPRPPGTPPVRLVPPPPDPLDGSSGRAARAGGRPAGGAGAGAPGGAAPRPRAQEAAPEGGPAWDLALAALAKAAAKGLNRQGFIEAGVVDDAGWPGLFRLLGARKGEVLARGKAKGTRYYLAAFAPPEAASAPAEPESIRIFDT